MRLPEKNDGIGNPITVEVRLQRVLTWLSEFRFSSQRVLCRVAGVPETRNSMKTSRLFQRMESMMLIAGYRQPVLGGEKLFMASRMAEAYAIYHKLECARRRRPFFTDHDFMRRSPTLLHDLHVQSAIVNRMGVLDEVVAEETLQLSSWGHGRYNRPDALARTTSGAMIAIELELTCKSRPRIYQAFQSHIMAVKDGLYSNVIYLFPDMEVMRRYQLLYGELLWPVFSRHPEKGHVRQEQGVFDPGEWRDRIHLVHEPVAKIGRGAG